jgi:meso-butanediol dehydrogenase/(S,S)-butanediol dehydrogenase/diacetyl reductase
MIFAADSFNGRVALVPGAGSGIGAATARAFARCGAAVAAVDRDAATAQQMAADIEAGGGRAIACVFDIADAEAVIAGIAAIEQQLGPIDILVNNAGIRDFGSFLDLTPALWQAVLNVNLTGPFLCAQAVVRRLIERKVPGAIVNVASVAGLTGVSDRVAYVASKHGLVGLTKALALDLAPHGIRVNAIAPGATETALSAELPQKTADDITNVAHTHPLGRWGKPEEMADLILFLASDAAGFITGIVAPADGGFLAGKKV